jgi:enolase-phosphatase E1
MSLVFDGISHVLLDIEGTTCPVSFVAATLFPYAKKHLGHYLQRHGAEAEVKQLVAEVEALWNADPHPEAQALLNQGQDKGEPGQQPPVEAYLQWLIRNDRKVTALKELQGWIWEEGYRSGVLKGPLFAVVPEALQRWHQQGLVLAVYSSGSVAAQQLLYGHSSAGDLRPLFSHWFDTRTGAKQDPESYRQISNAMQTKPAHILFVSDVLAELEAASTAGLRLLFSSRSGNPHRDAGSYPSTETYANVTINAN